MPAKIKACIPLFSQKKISEYKRLWLKILRKDLCWSYGIRLVNRQWRREKLLKFTIMYLVLLKIEWRLTSLLIEPPFKKISFNNSKTFIVSTIKSSIVLFSSKTSLFSFFVLSKHKFSFSIRFSIVLKIVLFLIT